ncbi:ribosome small subunit-dependent GTPase A [Chitinophaga defluvii]|uniref:Small ribosomal subunit biogenesis GTPase RsgA n=1 Tax=Chitinophaga defluvii TaxID=3163343 RepID=A0ABV2T239_9BACT
MQTYAWAKVLPMICPVNNTAMSLLLQYGWNTAFENNYANHKNNGLDVGRVLTINGYLYTLIGEAGIITAELSGTLLNGKESGDLPKVGDWVVFKAYEEQGYVIEVLPRLNELSRKMPGKGMDKQVIAANVDAALLLQGLDRDFNLMRIQRYLYQVANNGIGAIVVLNKKDLVENPQYYQREVASLGYQCPVVLTSALDNEGVAELASQHLEAGKTYALLGTSGAGKSTLMNALWGGILQKEGAVSMANSKGKHTTTYRSLVLIPNGCMVIDSPGMREFGITIATEEMEGTFHPQIAALAAHCKFGDCTHHQEPGCAVMAAMEEGTLPEVVYQSYLKLYREQQRYGTHAADRKRVERQFGRITRQAKDFRQKRKY